MGRLLRVRGLLDKLLAIAPEPNLQGMVGALLRISKEQRKIVGDGLVDPLVAIGVPADDIAPPLMRDFVERYEFGEVLLSVFRESGPLLGLRGQIGIGGEIKQSGPALAEATRDLRHAQFLKRERTTERFVKADGVFNLAAEPLRGVGRPGCRRRYRHRINAGASLSAER